jgi:hypothetical protein
MRAVLNLVEGLLGEGSRPRQRRERDGRAHRMRQRLDELRRRSVAGRAGEDGRSPSSVRRCGGNLRLLVGMVRANQPSASSLACRARWRSHSAPPHTR